MQTSWKIDWLKCDNQNSDYEDVVCSAGWSAKTIDGNFEVVVQSGYSDICSGLAYSNVYKEKN